MKVSAEEVAHIASLAQLELSADECARMQRDLSAILGYIDKLNQLDTADVVPMEHLFLDANSATGASAATLREDAPRPGLAPAQAVANAPATAANFFKVPKIIDRG